MTETTNLNKNYTSHFLLLFGVHTFLSISLFNHFQSEPLTFAMVLSMAISYYFMFRNKSRKVQLIALIPFAFLITFAVILNPGAWYIWSSEVIVFSITLWGIFHFSNFYALALAIVLISVVLTCFYFYSDSRIQMLNKSARQERVLQLSK